MRNSFLNAFAIDKAKEHGGRLFRPTIDSVEEFLILLLIVGIGMLGIPLLIYKVVGFLIGMVWKQFKRFLDGDGQKKK